jgi:hypothetical protein
MLKFFAAISFALLIMSCSNSRSTDSDEMVLKYNIIAGQGGGVTGIMEGTFIDTAGVVYSFQGRTFDSASKEKKRDLTSEEISEINEMIAELVKLDYRQSGNIYNFIILRKNNRPDIRFSWVNSPGTESHPPLLQEFFVKIVKIESH